MKKRTSRIAAYLLAVSLAAAALPTMGANAEETADTTIIYSSDFEDGDVSAWTNRGDRDTTILTVSEENAVSGTACTSKELAPASTKELILKHFNSITPGNEMKPDALLDQKACLALAEAGDDENPQVSLASANSILNFAQEKRIVMQ